jgi:uncharacterized protein (DUF1330 family)
MPATYLVAQIRIDDRARYLEYQERFLPLFAAYAAEILVVDEAAELLEGEWPYTRTVLLRFRDRAEARRFYDSPGYQALARIRRDAAVGNIVLVDAFDPATLQPASGAEA